MITKRAVASILTDDSGVFDMVLSNDTLDRDGDVLSPGDWVQPLPKSIAINVNHSSDVQDIVASGHPFIDGDGNLRVVGSFADTDQAQHVRALVAGGHLRSVSVEFLRRKDGTNELVGGAFVNIPANPDARVLSAKQLADFDARLDAIFAKYADVVDDEPAESVESKAAALLLRAKAYA